MTSNKQKQVKIDDYFERTYSESKQKETNDASKDVQFDGARQRWIVQVRGQKKKYFSVTQYGSKEEAYVKAVEYEKTLLRQTVSLNEDQLSFVHSNIEPCSVYGNPGCGKTRTIIEYCIQKFHDKIVATSAHFLILSFSKKAQTDFIKRGKHSSKPQLFNTCNVRTIHSLASSISYKLLNKQSDSRNTVILATYKHILSDALNLHQIKALQKCKFIIIDEAQDLNENQYNLAKLITDKLNIPLILVGDPNQNIYQFQGGSDKFLLNHSKVIYNLTTNYRSTNQIVQFCNHLRPHNFLPFMSSGKHTNHKKPLVYCNSLASIKKHIIQELSKNDYNLEDIAIIGSVKKSNDNYTNIGLQLICNFLDEHKIKFVKQFADSNSECDEKIEFDVVKGHVNVITAHASKGLEFKKTLVVNFHYTTFTRVPSEDEHQQHKYLWYVALSRSMEELIVYVDSGRDVFPSIEQVPTELYEIEGYCLRYPKKFKQDEVKKKQFHVTDILYDNKYFNENTLYEWNNQFQYTVQKHQLFDIQTVELYEYARYDALYGLFMEKLFMFYYYKNQKNVQAFIDMLKQRLHNILFVDASQKKTYNQLIQKGIISGDKELNLDKIDNYTLSQKEGEFVSSCFQKMNSKQITVLLKLDTYEYDELKLVSMIDSLLRTEHGEQVLFDIVLYFYQIDNECKYVLNQDFSAHFQSVSPYFAKLDVLSCQNDNLQFQVATSHPHLPLDGIIDVLHDKTVIELKFVKRVSDKHVIQTLLYYNNLYYNWSSIQDIEIWNFLDGCQYKIQFENGFTNWQLNCFLCKILDIQMTNNVFMLDLETNTIDENVPFTQDYNNEIIDRYVYEYNLKCCVSDGLIKNKHKLVTTHVHHITELNLIRAEPDIIKFKQDVQTIMKYCKNPLFIAHNGNRFDFKILYYYGILDQTLIETLDSAIFLRLFIQNSPSNKLVDLYNTLFCENYIQEHRAKSDTMMIAKICERLQLTHLDLIQMA